MNRKLITSALPYVNNVPHLGNLIQVLSADVFARFCRSRGYDTLYVCGTDEYGTATETKALEEGKTPRELCDYYYAVHNDIYRWFDISFDIFGRTSNEASTAVTQQIFSDLDANGYITEHVTQQLYCPHCQMFLADRYVHGNCPKCGHTDARGDQCDVCGALLEPTDLMNPRCVTCGTSPCIRDTKHLYLNLPALSEQLETWLESASGDGRWAANAVQMTKAWIRDGLNERAITRDLTWGIPVPKAGYDDKVFYVWFNAAIGYISITKQLADELSAAGKQSFDYKSWWLPSESDDAHTNVELFQFIGKDNILFHTVIFPASLLGSGRNWIKLYHMSSTEFLNYEDGKFSKSKGVGVFGSDAQASGIPADGWRFYIFYNRPEKSDYQFTWKDFQERYNGELIGNLGNLVNRTVLFVNKYYDGVIPDAPVDETLWQPIREHEAHITELLEWAELRDAFRELFAISDIGNKAFQAAEPWKTRTSDPQKAATLIHNLCYVIKDLMIMVHPFLPQYAQTVMAFFGKRIADTRVGVPMNEGDLTWNDIGTCTGLSTVGKTAVYFTPLSDKTVRTFRERFSGAASAPLSSDEKQVGGDPAEPIVDQATYFTRTVSLKVAKIVSVERNPQSDKLYIEHLDDGSGTDRVIQSGLVDFLPPEALLGKHIILVANLAPRVMRGVESRGMLLAADYTDAAGSACVEVLTAPWAAPGTPVVLSGSVPDDGEKPDKITIDAMDRLSITVTDYAVCLAGQALTADGKPLMTASARTGGVH
ncbi:MAG: methionine--tRNA ligase [Treponema sp.]|nr:methionine--tRNA ligase [Treponema sp.]